MKLLAAISVLSLFFSSATLAFAYDHANHVSIEMDDQNITHVNHQDYLGHHASVQHKFRGQGGTKFPRRINSTGERVFFFSPRFRAWAAYGSDGKRVGYGRANGGANWCADAGRPCRTPLGKFRVQSKGSPACKSRSYPRPRGGAPMPYCMFFLSAYAIHGSPYISTNNSSHGCIRVQNKAARWLSNEFMRIGTRVVVLSY